MLCGIFHSFFDTIEERYQKMKRCAQTFIICQFGKMQLAAVILGVF